MSYKTSFKDGRLGIGLSTSVNSGAPKYPLDINGDIRLTGAILKSDGTTYTSGSGMGTPGIVSNQTDGIYKIGVNNINPTAALDISGDVLPSLTGTFDLGSVDRRWKDVFITENSFWIGDRHKMSISSTGRMRFRKRKKNTLPKKIRNMAQFANAGTTADAHAKTVSIRGQTFTDINNMTMTDVVTYVRENVTGMEKAAVSDIYEDDDEDYEDDNDLEGDMKISGDLQLNGTLKDSAGNPRIFSNWTIDGSDLTRDSNITVTGDLQLNGTLKDSNGNPRIFSNWTIASNTTDLYRPSGNVGIGTATPGFPLHINCSDQYNDGLYIAASNGSYGADSNGGNFLFHQNQHSSSTSRALRLEEWSNTHSHKRTIMTWQRYTGNVGIGFHTPSYKLHVNGNTYIAGTLQATSTVTAPTFSGSLSGTATYTSNVHVQNRNGQNTTYKMMFCNSSGWQSTSNIMCDDDSSNGPRYNPYSHTLYCNTFSGSLSGSSTSCSGTSTYATYANNVHVTNFSNTSGVNQSSEEAHTHKLVMIDKGGDEGWKNTGQLGVHNESDGLRYNINYHTLYGLKQSNMDRINLLDQGDALNNWKISCNGGLGHSIYTGSFTTPGSLGTYYRCEFPGPVYKWGTLWVGRGTHDDSSWRGAFAFKIMFHAGGYGHFNSGEYRVLGYDNDTRTWIAKVGDSYTQSRLYLWLQGGSTYKWAGDGIYHYTTSSSDTVTSGTMPTEWDSSVSTSDDRIKHNEKNIDGLKVINKLNPMRYFKTNKPYSENFHFDLDNSGNPITDETYTIETGLIAQEVRKIPELEHLVYGEDWYDLDKELEEMRENGEDIPEMDLSGNHIDMSGNKIPRKLQLRYKDIFVYNIAATQELSKEVEILKKENQELKDRLTKIEEYLGL